MPVSLLSKRSARAGGAVAIALMVAGCGPQYEIDRPGTWRPTGANDFNLRSMAQDTRDMSYGQSTTTDRGNAAARAVNRLYTDRRRPLLDVSLSKIAPSQGGDSSGGGDSPGGGSSGGGSSGGGSSGGGSSGGGGAGTGGGGAQ